MSRTPVFTFSQKNAQRIARTVRDHEAKTPEARPITAEGGSAQDGGFWAIITASVKPTSARRWRYTIRQARKISQGYDGWEAITGAGTFESDQCFNTFEDLNGATGQLGNGVSTTNLTGTFDIKPAPNELVIWARTVRFKDGEDLYTEYWFSYANGVDGSC